MNRELIKQQEKTPVFKCSIDDIESFKSCPISIVQNRMPVSLTPAEHCHESYEFVLPVTAMPHSKLGKKECFYYPNNIYPINSGHEHGVVKPMSGISLDCIMVDKLFMNEITYSIAGKSDISFIDCLPPDRNLIYLINSFIQEEKAQQTGYRLVMENLATQILVHLIRHSRNSISLPAFKQPTISKGRMTMICELIHEKYKNNVSLEELAREANLSPYHFIRAFKAQTGKTPYEYLLDIKIERAKEMMHLDIQVTEICFLCGFSNLSHFSTTFKRRVGVSPTQYRSLLLGE